MQAGQVEFQNDAAMSDLDPKCVEASPQTCQHVSEFMQYDGNKRKNQERHTIQQRWP